MMTRTKNASTEPQFAALIGIDWADQKHDVCLCEMDSDQSEHRVIEQTPEAIDEGSDPKPCLRIMFPVLTGLPIVSC
jgi:hypothetical protein